MYIRATKEHVNKTTKKVEKITHNYAEIEIIVEYLLNVKGFTMHSHKANYV